MEKGEQLPERVIGPHSVASFTTEHRARPATVWGAAYYTEGPTGLWDAGWISEMGRDFDRATYDPSANDGLLEGASRGHVDPEHAQLIGMPRSYGYGSSMGSWILDYVENWAGEGGWTGHVLAQYRNPAFVGDITDPHRRGEGDRGAAAGVRSPLRHGRRRNAHADRRR